jgi:hypothetical protein
MTHLREPDVLKLLRFFSRQLTPGGVVVFTAHGDFVAERMPRHEYNYGLTDSQIHQLVAGYNTTGFAYTDYPGTSGYGVSLSSPDWIRTQMNTVTELEEVLCRERLWDHHHDVFAFRRPA